MRDSAKDTAEFVGDLSERQTTAQGEMPKEGPFADGAPTEKLEDASEMGEAIRKERDQYHDLWLRKQAEFDNYRKRVIREKEDLRTSVQAEILTDILPVIDAGERGLAVMEAAKPGTELNAYLDGYRLLLKQLRQLLERYQVREVPGEGSEFDPRFHEAVLREETDEHDNRIIEEYRKGYLIGEKLLRPSQVRVSVMTQRSED